VSQNLSGNVNVFSHFDKCFPTDEGLRALNKPPEVIVDVCQYFPVDCLQSL